MCGALSSKFRSRNRVDPSPEPDSKPKTSRVSFVKNVTVEEQEELTEKPSTAKLPGAAGSSNDQLPASNDSENQVLKRSPSVCDVQVLDPAEIVRRAELRAMESARQILAAQSDCSSSSSARIEAPFAPVNTRSVSLGDTPGSTAFEILVGDKRTVCAAARIPRRLRKLDVPPQLTADKVLEKMKAVEEKRLKALERIRAAAKVKETEHPAKELARATAQKISDKMSVADIKRNKVLERKRQAGQEASRAKRRIADAQAYAHVQMKSAIEEKRIAFEMRQVESAGQMVHRKRRREAHVQKVKEKVCALPFFPSFLPSLFPSFFSLSLLSLPLFLPKT